ncbi:amylase cluster transcriptional regulator AmyR [Emericellopsis cladophorae]|uniref:Amylase cluster transcriptional regulator AmyR n=1 Tax=Emericellopsis cladophorae TaxID=2686198 RepID=A0A9P9XUF5_9HYPO|nr:amylase cluster transcriptional regulator AmyR [Emericellopsis cladophorae]KAI6777999.1 amylase cluster transcriptional regulator AmyR [Emericellopsis cladophorae]
MASLTFSLRSSSELLAPALRKACDRCPSGSQAKETSVLAAGSMPSSSSSSSSCDPFLLDDRPTTPRSSYPIPNFCSPSLNNGLLFDLAADASTTETPSFDMLYFDRLYPVFSVLDGHQLDSTASCDQYALVSSLSAAITAQLNLVDPSTINRPSSSSASSALCSSATSMEQHHLPGQVWADHALQARQAWDYMSAPTESTIMTSFFLFVYHDNVKQPQKAGYYLREAIGFALALALDDPDTGSVLLRSTIPLPQVFTSPQPKLIFGFVSLVHLFKCVDDKFVSLWRTSRAVLTWERPSAPSVASDTGQAALQGTLCAAVVAGQRVDGELVEVQRLDIAVTQQWLHLLAWQFQGAQAARSRRVPFVVSRETLGVVTRADRQALKAHGIGVEQKLFAIACCVSDVLQRSAEIDRDAVSTGHQYLHGFIRVLSSFRNRESESLQPLLARATKTLTAELSVPPTLTLPRDSKVSRRGGEWPGCQ